MLAISRNYTCLVTQLEDMASGERSDITGEDQAKIKGYLRQLKSHKFVLYHHSYRDLLEDMAELSKVFQDSSIPLSAVRTSIETSQARLQAQTHNPGVNLTKVLEEVTEDNGWVFKGIALTTRANEVTNFTNKSKEVLDKVISCIHKRFANFVDDPILRAADILNPANYPSETDDLLAYGNGHIDEMVVHFNDILVAKGCDIDCVQREWDRLKFEVTRHHKEEKFQALWKKILVEKQDRFPNVLHLVRILLVCPVASAHVERQFSYIKRALGDWRLNLGVSTLEDLLRISSEGPKPEDFQPERVVERWSRSSVRARRPDVAPYGPRQ